MGDWLEGLALKEHRQNLVYLNDDRLSSFSVTI